MTVNDLVLTPDGLLAIVEEIAAEQIRVTIVNHATSVLYPKATPLPVVARAAELERARATKTAPAPKEG